MTKFPGVRGTIAILALAVLVTTSALFAQTHLSFIHMPEINAANGNSVAYPIYLSNGLPVDQVVAPIRFSPGTHVEIDSISTEGSRFEGLGLITTGINSLNKEFWIKFDADLATPLFDGDGVIATVYFTIAPSAPAHDISVDSTSFDDMSYLIQKPSGDIITDLFVAGTVHVFALRPTIHLDPENFSFTTTEDINPPSQDLEITNLGVDPLNWDITYKPTWLNLSAMSGTAPSTVALSPDVLGMAIGTYNDSVVVHDEFATTKFKTAYISLEITETPQQPTIFLDPENFLFTTTEEVDPASQDLSITNIGLGVLNWDISYKPTWLNLSATTGTAPSTVSLSPDVTGLAVGTYNDSLVVHDENATTQSKTAYVVLEIAETPRPTISLDPENFFFSTTEEIDPASQNLAITNVGLGVLNWDISYKPTWLNLSSMSGTAPSTVVLLPDVTGMAVGTYNDSLVVHDEFATTPFKTTYVNLEITEGSQEETRCIALHEGWNLISWNLDTPDDNVETIVASIKGCIQAVFGFEAGALSYDPDLPQFSTLNSLDHLHGYWFRMECDTVLCVTGIKASSATPLELERNWNLVSYLPDDVNATEIALQTMIENLVVALGYDNGGLTYDPINPELATLENMQRDFGYWLKCTDPSTLVYPGTEEFFGIRTFQLNTESKLLPNLTPTREWVNLYGEAITLDGQILKTGSVVELYDESGVLCGQAVVEESGHLRFTPAYFDDKSTLADEGIDADGRLSMSVDGEPVRESFSYLGFGDRVQIGELTSVVKLSDALPSAFSMNQNYPNPFNPTTMIEFNLPTSAHARIEIFNLLGAKVGVIMDRNLAPGRYSVTWNGADDSGKALSSGVYFYRLTAGDFSYTRKMMLVK